MRMYLYLLEGKNCHITCSIKNNYFSCTSEVGEVVFPCLFYNLTNFITFLFFIHILLLLFFSSV